MATWQAARGQIAERFDEIVKDSTLYLVTVGNPTKAHLIAGQFSLRDTLSTHVGFAARQDGQLKVYHVTDVNPKKSALRKESLVEFLQTSRYNYVSIWRVALSNRDFRSIMDQIELVSQREVSFDYDFDLANGNALYCSEFCAAILNSAVIDGMHFAPEKRTLSEFYQKVLKREVLTYYPVDFFQSSYRMVKLAEDRQ